MRVTNSPALAAAAAPPLPPAEAAADAPPQLPAAEAADDAELDAAAADAAAAPTVSEANMSS